MTSMKWVRFEVKVGMKWMVWSELIWSALVGSDSHEVHWYEVTGMKWTWYEVTLVWSDFGMKCRIVCSALVWSDHFSLKYELTGNRHGSMHHKNSFLVSKMKSSSDSQITQLGKFKSNENIAKRENLWWKYNSEGQYNSSVISYQKSLHTKSHFLPEVTSYRSHSILSLKKLYRW